MAGKIDKLKNLASAINSEAKDMQDTAKDIQDTANKLSDGADILGKGIKVLEYWNPNDNRKRQEVKEKLEQIEKDIYNTIKKYLLLWCIMIIATIIICIKFI